MCLIVLAYQVHPRTPLVIAANRDEFHARPSAPADFWATDTQVLAGRDLLAGGSWLGLTRSGRVAAVTNVRESSGSPPYGASRGALVTGFLTSELRVDEFAGHLQPTVSDYGPFNLLLGSITDGFGLLSNRGGQERLAPGVYGISNEPMMSRWPKVERCKLALKQSLEHDEDGESLFSALSDRRPASTPPQVGADMETTALLSAPFVLGSTYGTRASTVITIGENGECRFEERRFDSAGHMVGHSQFRFYLV